MGSLNPPAPFMRGRSWRGKKLSLKAIEWGLLFQGQQDAVTICSIPYTSGLHLGRGAFSQQMAAALAGGLWCPSPMGRQRLQ